MLRPWESEEIARLLEQTLETNNLLRELVEAGKKAPTEAEKAPLKKVKANG